MHIAILTFEGFNELDSLIALGILNRVKSARLAGVARHADGAGHVDERRGRRATVDDDRQGSVDRLTNALSAPASSTHERFSRSHAAPSAIHPALPLLLDPSRFGALGVQARAGRLALPAETDRARDEVAAGADSAGLRDPDWRSSVRSDAGAAGGTDFAAGGRFGGRGSLHGRGCRGGLRRSPSLRRLRRDGARHGVA